VQSRALGIGDPSFSQKMQARYASARFLSIQKIAGNRREAVKPFKKVAKTPGLLFKQIHGQQRDA